MADITMCKGGSCPLKEKCKRFTSTFNLERQWVFTNVPYEDDKCEWYWGENQDSIYNQLINIVYPSTLPTIEIKDEQENGKTNQ